MEVMFDDNAYRALFADSKIVVSRHPFYDDCGSIINAGTVTI